MEYIVKTDFEKGDIVYAMGGEYGNSIFRLLVVGFQFHKAPYEKDTWVSYLCVMCDENGNPIGKDFEYSYRTKNTKYQIFQKYDLYKSIDELVSEKNINVTTELCEVCVDEGELYMTGEDVLKIEFPKEDDRD